MDQRKAMIKLKGRVKGTTKWVYCDIIKELGLDEPSEFFQYPLDPETVGRFTGYHDGKDVEIYEGDIIRYRRPFRRSQTHYGDNIPNGSFTEPMEPAIETIEAVVVFKEGAFGVDWESEASYQTIFMPLEYIQPFHDEESIKFNVELESKGFEIWDDPDEGDLQYLLESCKCNDVNELVDYVNLFEVIGNINDDNLG